MRPSFFSRKANHLQKRGWFQSGENVEYDESQYRREINELNKPATEKNYMQLSFDFTFEFAGDEVFCCYTVPYTYSEMQAYLDEIKFLAKK
jgi:hypothetical protein